MNPTWENPVWYRGYRIYSGSDYLTICPYDFVFVHDDYDGADDSTDGRCGHAHSIEDAKSEIDWMEDGQ